MADVYKSDEMQEASDGLNKVLQEMGGQLKLKVIGLDLGEGRVVQIVDFESLGRVLIEQQKSILDLRHDLTVMSGWVKGMLVALDDEARTFISEQAVAVVKQQTDQIREQFVKGQEEKKKQNTSGIILSGSNGMPNRMPTGRPKRPPRGKRG